MDCEWISLTGSDEGFWNHEWSKHGTCSLSVLPTQEDYFAKALELNSQYDLNVALEENGIDLSSGDDVRTEDVEEAIQEAFGVSGAVFKCSRNALVEIQMCIDKTTFEAFSCPSSLSTTCSSYVDIPSSSSGDVPAQCAAYFPDGQKTSSSSSSSSSSTTTTQGEDSGTSSSSSYYSSFFSMMMMMMMMMMMIVIVFVSVV
jgi:ribonuclease T2